MGYRRRDGRKGERVEKRGKGGKGGGKERGRGGMGRGEKGEGRKGGGEERGRGEMEEGRNAGGEEQGGEDKGIRNPRSPPCPRVLLAQEQPPAGTLSLDYANGTSFQSLKLPEVNYLLRQWWINLRQSAICKSTQAHV